ncbi:MAG TPA: imidazole glycerol phosphate synthase subunit HisF [Candidatus Polarisedimenticolia bacterium]
MRARRVIPCLDVRGGRVVKGVRFAGLKDAGDPVERARAYDREGADEVCLLDISATLEGRRPLHDLVGRVADLLSVPFSVGGGVRDLDEMRSLLLLGADRVSIGTAALDDPTLIDRAAERFGRQFVIVSIDARRNGDRFEVTSHGGRRPRGQEPIAWALEAERRGAGEILLNVIDADGTRAGYEIELTRRLARAVRVPVVASGGAGDAEDIARVLREGEADAALAASIFHDGSRTIRGVKEHLRARGIAVRL